MKFSCEKAVVMQAVMTASRAVSSKSPIPVLEGLLIKASDEGVSVTGYNLETGIRTNFGASVYQNGILVVNSRIFCDIIRKLPDGMVTIEVNDRLLITITCGMCRFDIVGIKPDEFPDLPNVEREKSFFVASSVLKDMVNTTIFSVSENTNKPIHTGELFNIKDGYIDIVAVDGYRLSVRREKLDSGSENIDNMSFVVPASALRELERILEATDDMVCITFGGKHILFEIKEKTLVSRLLEGEFLNYEKTIPLVYDHKIIVSTKSLIDKIDRVALVISERLKNAVRVVFGKDNIVMTCITALGKSYDECPCKGDAGGLEMGFNNRFLLEALRSCSDDEVAIEIKNSLSPAVIRPLEGDKYVYMILPVRLKNE